MRKKSRTSFKLKPAIKQWPVFKYTVVSSLLAGPVLGILIYSNFAIRHNAHASAQEIQDNHFNKHDNIKRDFSNQKWKSVRKKFDQNPDCGFSD